MMRWNRIGFWGNIFFALEDGLQATFAANEHDAWVSIAWTCVAIIGAAMFYEIMRREEAKT